MFVTFTATKDELRSILAKVQGNAFAAHVMQDLVDYLHLYSHDS